MTDAPREPSVRILAAFLSGECSTSETEDVLRWARSNPEHAAQLEALRAVWPRDGERPRPAAPTWSADDIWSAIAPRLDHAQPPALQLVPNRPRRTPAVGIARRRNVAAWATAVACGILIVGVWTDQRVSAEQARHRPQITPPPREYRTDRGQRASVTLPDGSAFQLGPLSVLRVPVSYGAPDRTVDLEGDGYFNVAHDAAHPFAVRTARTTVRDVGTRFIVRARAGERRTEIAVADGEVAIEPRAASGDASGAGAWNGSASRLLSAGQAALVDDRGAVTLLPRASVDAAFAWTHGEFVFEHTLVPDVLTELGRWYGTTFVLADKSLDTVRLHTTLRGETLLEALVVLETALDVDTHVRGDTVTLTRHTSDRR